MNLKVKPIDIAAEYLLCPISQRRLSEAVIILPCSCKVNQEIVEKIKVKSEAIFLAIETTYCPVCSKKIFGYCIDEKTRNCVKDFFKAIEQSLSTLEIKEQPTIWKGPLPVYPGIRGNFVTKDDFSPDKHMFSSTNDSIVKWGFFVCNPEGSNLQIGFKPSQEFLNFLMAHEISVDDIAREKQILDLCEPEQMKKLFKILIKENDFINLDTDFIIGMMDNLPYNNSAPVAFAM